MLIGREKYIKTTSADTALIEKFNLLPVRENSLL